MKKLVSIVLTALLVFTTTQLLAEIRVPEMREQAESKLTWDFNQNDILGTEDWYTIDNDNDGSCWVQQGTFDPETGDLIDGYMVSEPSIDENEVDNWLVSPEFICTGDLKFDFWVQQTDIFETVEVYVYDAESGEWELAEPLFASNLQGYVIGLNYFVEHNIRVAFRHYGQSSSPVCIDNVQVTTGRYVNVEGVEFCETELVLECNSCYQLSWNILPKNADNQNVDFESSDTYVFEVSSEGQINTICPGEAYVTITTQDGGHTGTCHVTVLEPVLVEEISIVPSTITIPANQECAINVGVHIYPTDAELVDINWHSSNPSVVSVDDGKLTGYTPGSAVITAITSSGIEANNCCYVTVVPNEVFPHVLDLDFSVIESLPYFDVDIDITYDACELVMITYNQNDEICDGCFFAKGYSYRARAGETVLFHTDGQEHLAQNKLFLVDEDGNVIDSSCGTEYPQYCNDIEYAFVESGVYYLIIANPMKYNPECFLSFTAQLISFDSVIGDVNGDGNINSSDANLAMRIALALVSPTPSADANGDGVINTADANIIMRWALEL